MHKYSHIQTQNQEDEVNQENSASELKWLWWENREKQVFDVLFL